MRLTVTDKISHPGKSVNEDLFGHNDQAAWIFDGATGIATNTIPAAESDPHWLVHTLSEEIKRVWDNDLPTRDILLKAAENTIVRYLELLPDPPPLIDRPTACLTIVRLLDKKLEISVLGDSGVLVKNQDGILTFGCVPSPSSIVIREERERLLASGTLPDELMDRMLPVHRAFRSSANIDGGYNIVDTTTRWVDRMRVNMVDARPGDRLLFVTDGFYRLIDVFQKYRAENLVEAATKFGLAPLYQELRQLERDDPLCQAFPRAKVSDDVCAAMLTIG